YHLLIETPRANLSRGMRHLNGVYTQSFNRRHKRTGHVFQGRFKAILVEKESHLLEVARYVVLNPVRAKMAKYPRQWTWSSYRATVGEIASPAFLSASWLLEQLDRQPKRACLTYQRFVREGVGLSLWDDLRGGVLLGNEEFAEQIRPLLHAAVQSKEIPRVERMLAKPTLEELFQDMKTDKALRNERIHTAVREHDYTLFQLQEYLGLHYSTISRIVKRVDVEKRSKNKT
ncbi:addiction module toxin RelE, partial [Candidatus Bipolaricaulota bacterium]|nr:addiction module toxin RelE [Candidatus Bipolaricaulota bacterium]